MESQSKCGTGIARWSIRRDISKAIEGKVNHMLHGYEHGHGHGRGWGHGRRSRRGEMPPAVLALLGEQDMHGYQMIREISDRTGGAWSPSPGSIYPALQMLEDQGLVTSQKVGDKRVFSLTDTGRKHAEMLAPEGPWAQIAEGDAPERDLRHALASLTAAAMQIAHAGSSEDVATTVAILNDARKKMYAMLAGDD